MPPPPEGVGHSGLRPGPIDIYVQYIAQGILVGKNSLKQKQEILVAKAGKLIRYGLTKQAGWSLPIFLLRSLMVLT
jgi:hypothetical protein